jgi:undecaprenyl pyrophosphate phosphatase UppP
VPGADPGHQPLGRHHHRGDPAGLLAQGATEFSFYLGIPTLMGAGAYSVWKDRDLLRLGRPADVRVGTVVSFFARWCASAG